MPRLRVKISRPDEEALFGAAYLTLAETGVVVEEDGVTLLDARGGAKERFLARYAEQKERWALMRATLDLRAETLRRALALAEAAPKEGPVERLPESALAEIRRLLAEAEGEPHDPRGVTRAWDPEHK